LPEKLVGEILLANSEDSKWKLIETKHTASDELYRLHREIKTTFLRADGKATATYTTPEKDSGREERANMATQDLLIVEHLEFTKAFNAPASGF
jgi:hypothetical protein